MVSIVYDPLQRNAQSERRENAIAAQAAGLLAAESHALREVITRLTELAVVADEHACRLCDLADRIYGPEAEACSAQAVRGEKSGEMAEIHRMIDEVTAHQKRARDSIRRLEGL